MMINAIVISNNIEGLENYYQSNDEVHYTVCHITKDFSPDLQGYDLLVVPNGSDHIAMQKIKKKVRAFLDQGNALICCDGWFTNWVPGNQWYMDNSKKSIDTRYFIEDDPFHFLDGLNIDEFIFSHGISGYWACGYIESAKGAHVILEDTWKRAIVVLDEVTTAGCIFLTASGPLADTRYNPDDNTKAKSALAVLYRKFIQHLINKKTLNHV